MELKEFVQATLVEILEGVKDVQEGITSKGGDINPPLGGAKPGMLAKPGHPVSSCMQLIEHVEFDVGRARARRPEVCSVKVFKVKADAQAKGTTANEQSHRVKFRVPIVFPMSE